MGQISGKAAVKPCALFCGMCGIVLHERRKTRCKRLYMDALQQGKIKALHRVGARQKKSPAGLGRGSFYSNSYFMLMFPLFCRL